MATMQEFAQSSTLFGGNAPFIEEQYEAYLSDPAAVGSDWRTYFDVNVLSGVRLARAYLPGMMKRNRGRIVFISSESGLLTPGAMIHYGMTKTAQLAVSRGLAELTKGTKVTVNAVLPGPTRSEGIVDFLKICWLDPESRWRCCTKCSGAVTARFDEICGLQYCSRSCVH